MADRDAAARLYRHACREAWIALAIWAAALVWSVGYCYLRGYIHTGEAGLVFSALEQNGLAVRRSSDNFQLVWGLPDWVAYGIFLPWMAATAATVWFCLWGMKDDELGVEAGEGAIHGH